MLNKVILVGRLGADPKINEKKVATIKVATSKRAYKTADGTQIPERTEWHNCSFFGGLADTAVKYLKKGDMVYLEGELQTTSYEKNGDKRYYTCVAVSHYVKCGGKE